jgi:membrane dipeptidase
MYNPASTQKIDEELWKKAMEIHNDAIVIDAHAHPMTSYVLNPEATPDNLDLGKKTELSTVDFISMKEGGLDVVFFGLPLINDINEGNPSKKILDDIVLIRNHVNRYSSLAEIALSPGDIRRIHGLGKRAILFGIEYPSILEGHTVMLEAYSKMGVRIITLAPSKIDPIVDTNSEEAGQSGLSSFGKEVVWDMNRLGMLIDISHASDDLQLSIIQESKVPVIASHSCVRALSDKPRNIPDEILKEIAEMEGAIMITFHSAHLSLDYSAKHNEAFGKFNSEKRKLEEKLKDNKAELAKQLKVLKEKIFLKGVDIGLLIDHIDHAIKIAGVDHVGLGSDCIAGIGSPIGLETAAGYPLITYHLLKRGYKAEEIKKILGGNLLRIFSQAQKVSSASSRK